MPEKLLHSRGRAGPSPAVQKLWQKEKNKAARLIKIYLKNRFAIAANYAIIKREEILLHYRAAGSFLRSAHGVAVFC